jgi:hypothetical protein
MMAAFLAGFFAGGWTLRWLQEAKRADHIIRDPWVAMMREKEKKQHRTYRTGDLVKLKERIPFLGAHDPFGFGGRNVTIIGITQCTDGSPCYEVSAKLSRSGTMSTYVAESEIEYLCQ